VSLTCVGRAGFEPATDGFMSTQPRNAVLTCSDVGRRRASRPKSSPVPAPLPDMRFGPAADVAQMAGRRVRERSGRVPGYHLARDTATEMYHLKTRFATDVRIHDACRWQEDPGPLGPQAACSCILKGMEFRGARAHLLGVLGQGLSALVPFLSQQGIAVTGEDQAAPDPNDPLHRVVLDLRVPLAPITSEAELRSAAYIVPASYVSPTHPTLLMAARIGVPVIPRLAALQACLTNHAVLAVAGGTGKSTTTSILHQILSSQSPTALYVGAACPHIGDRNYAVTAEGIGVVEACEFRREFLHLNPAIAVVTNLLWGDHADFFESQREMHNSFAKFIQGRMLVANWDDSKLRTLVQHESHSSVVRVGVHHKSDWSIGSIATTPDGSSFQLAHRSGERLSISTPLPGKHNVSNVALAVVCALESGSPSEPLIQACRSLTAPRRRIEVLTRGKEGSVLIDDYAHNPSQWSAGLQSIRLRWPKHSVTAIVQLSVHSRVLLQLKEFLEVFGTVEEVALLPIQPGSLDTVEQKQSIRAEDIVAMLSQQGTRAEYLADEVSAVAFSRSRLTGSRLVYVAGSRRAARIARSIAASVDQIKDSVQ
jgi:UDP-N-acetylmuramate--alanine ligase